MATGRYSTFPTVIDKLKLLPELKDMTVEQVGKIARYNELIIKGKNGTLTSAEQLELDALHQEMKTYNLSPTDWNTVISAMINIEKYFNDTILTEIGTMVDNAESQINTSVTNGVSVVDNKVNSVIPQIDKYVSDLINNNANVVSVGHLRNQFIITSETNKVAIGIHGFNANTDVLTLTVSGTQYYQYQNGSGDYTIDSATNIITLVGDKKFYVNEIVLIEVVKNVMKNVPTMDVSLLADDSIMRVKLDQDTQDILNHMERVVDNQSFTVPSTAWVGTEPNLTYQIVHNMNNKNLIVGVVDTDTQMSKLPDFKYIDMNTIEMHSVSKDNITVVINANGYSGSDGNTVAQEVIDARKGEVSLKSKIDGIDSQLADIPKQYASKNDVANISSGTPLFASTVVEMTDTTRNYVNTTDGYLYSYNGASFEKTTVQYQSTGIENNSIDNLKLKNDTAIFRNNLIKNTLINPLNENCFKVDSNSAYNVFTVSEFDDLMPILGEIKGVKCTTNQEIVTGTKYLVKIQINDVTSYLNKNFNFQMYNKGTSKLNAKLGIYVNDSDGGVNQSLKIQDLVINTVLKKDNISVLIPQNTTRIYVYIYLQNQVVPTGESFYLTCPIITNDSSTPSLAIHTEDKFYTETYIENKLLQAENRIAILENAIGETPKDTSPMLVIIDDDGRSEAYNLWKPLIQEKQIPICIAPMLYNQMVDNTWNNTISYMTPLQMLEMQDLGVEFLNHGNKSILTATVYNNYTYMKMEYVDSKKFHKEIGLGRTEGQEYYVYPGNINGTQQEQENYKNMIKKYFRCGINNGVDMIWDIENTTIDLYDIPRVNADSKTSAFLISKLDETIAKKGVLILLSHSYRNTTVENGDTSIFYNRFNPLIDYAKNNNVKIVTFTEMLKAKKLIDS